MNLLSSASIFSFFTLISRILGYLRDILIAIFLGASIFADAFFVAFRLPNTFRRLFAEGTFNAAFIPSYTAAKLKNRNTGKIFADNVLSFLLLVLFFVVTLAEIFTPYLVYLIAPGFIVDDVKFNLAVEFTRITFPFLLFVSLSSFFSGILNSNNKFAAAAAAPIILNIVLISSLIISYYLELDFSKQLSYGVTLAGLIQLLFLVYVTLKYYKPNFVLNLKLSSKVKFFFRKLLPSILSSGVTQINILVGTIIASFQSGAVSYLYYADRVYQINLAIAGIAVGTVSLPVLSKAFKTNYDDNDPESQPYIQTRYPNGGSSMSSIAGFATYSKNFTEQLRLNTGIRYTQNQLDAKQRALNQAQANLQPTLNATIQNIQTADEEYNEALRRAEENRIQRLQNKLPSGPRPSAVTSSNCNKPKKKVLIFPTDGIA